MLKTGLALLLLSCVFACSKDPGKSSIDFDGKEKIVLTDEEWAKILPENNYLVTRRGQTEPAFSGKYLNNHQSGTYRCYDCGQPLFASRDKYDSGTGWPSFRQPIAAGAVIRRVDSSLCMPRTEVLCARCDAHLGHVFDDGPEPLGKRFCMNSSALRFEKK